MDILLFDLDGVLLNSAGYHRSLMETVRLVSLALGYGDQSLTAQDIEAFELRDITAEWDSSAILAALLLVEAWRTEPEITLPKRPPLQARPAGRRSFPDLTSFLREMDRGEGYDPLARAETLLTSRLDGGPPSRASAVRSILRGARDLNESPTFWLVQLFNLGSRRFEEVYRLPAGLETESYLETYDLPTLTLGERTALMTWLDRPDRAAAIMTNRPSTSLRAGPSASLRAGPSTSPKGIFNTPEAEIGARASGFERLPMVAAGDLGWRAAALGLDPEAFLKPSPVHALAGIHRALSAEGDSIEAAIRLEQAGEMDSVVRGLQDSRVSLFEDAPKGHSSARSAAQILHAHGVRIDLRLYGIAAGRERAEVLRGMGAEVHPDVRTALDAAIPGWR
jgi:phosphoglycolate phosphatase-like HAD superfamily hydrolase